MGKIIHPLGKKGGTLTPFVDGTASNEANINFYVVGNMEVYAIVDGTIVDIDEKDKLGNTITIKTNSFNYNNNENLYLTYCRLGEVLVNKGDKINAGSVIAKTIGTNYKTSNIITIFFSEVNNYTQITSIPITNRRTDINYIDLKKITNNGEEIIKSDNLQYYIRLIFFFFLELSIASSFVAKISESDLDYLVAIVAQERSWSEWGTDINSSAYSLSSVAKTEAVCRTIRNRAYAFDTTLVHAAGGLKPEQPYDETVSNFSAHNKYIASINGKIITFREFVKTVCSGGDFLLIEQIVEQYNGLVNNHSLADLYSITGFCGGDQVYSYRGSNVAEWDKFCCRDWNWFTNGASDKTPPMR